MINIAVMGYGTVGSGVVEVIDTNGERIAQRIGDALNVKYVLDIRDFPEDPIQEKIIHDFETIISDDEIQHIAGHIRRDNKHRKILQCISSVLPFHFVQKIHMSPSFSFNS